MYTADALSRPRALSVGKRASRNLRALALSPARLGTLLVGLIAFVGPLRPRADPDSWWHLATGKLILSTGAVPTTDPFSWTAFGRHWVAHEWLSQTLFAVVDGIGGAVGLLLLAGTLIGSAFVLLHRTLRRVTTNDWIIALCLGLSLYLSTITWTIRPHLFSVLFFAFFLDTLVAHRMGSGTRMIWWLVPMTALWANLHGAFVSGLILLGVFALVAAIERKKEARTLLFVGAVAVVAGAASPNGLAIYAHVVHVAQASAIVIEEWRPPGLRNTYGTVFSLVMVGVPVAMAMLRRREWALLAMTIVFGLFGAAAVKNVWLAGMVAAPALAWTLDRWGGVPASRPGRGMEKGVLVSAFGLFLAGAVAFSAMNLAGMSESELRGENDFPIAAAEVLNGRPEGRLLNHYTWGGYLIWKTPRFPVSVDGRNDMYSAAVLNDTARVSYLMPGWKRYLDVKEVRYVLWPQRQPLAQALRLLPEWRIIFEDRKAVLFERSPGAL